MAGIIERTDTSDRQVDPGRKWMRLMQVGLAMFFLLPFALIVAAITKDPIAVVLVFVGLLAAGNACLRFGKGRIARLKQHTE